MFSDFFFPGFFNGKNIFLEIFDEFGTTGTAIMWFSTCPMSHARQKNYFSWVGHGTGLGQPQCDPQSTGNSLFIQQYSSQAAARPCAGQSRPDRPPAAAGPRPVKERKRTHSGEFFTPSNVYIYLLCWSIRKTEYSDTSSESEYIRIFGRPTEYIGSLSAGIN